MLLEHLITLNTDQNVVGFLFYFFGGGAGGSLLIENRAFSSLWLSLSRSVRGSLYKSFFFFNCRFGLLGRNTDSASGTIRGAFI